MKTLNALWQLIVSHQLIVAYIAAIAIDNLPAPGAASNGFYKWFFGVAQVLAANLTRAKMGVQGTLAQKP